VYVGEYASWGNTLGNALAEASYMTTLERNGDVVQMASYAPLLAKLGHYQWYPDMIYFTNTQVMPTANYYVQQMFSANQGDRYLAAVISPEPAHGWPLSISATRDSSSGDLVIKLVNVSAQPVHAQVQLGGTRVISPTATCTTLSGDPAATNPGDPRAKNNVSSPAMSPATSSLQVGHSFACDVAGHSLTILRIGTRDGK
jgi:alpha-L-arabinofuranosidase